MGTFNPSGVSSWYRRRPTWQKVLLSGAFVVLLLVAVLATYLATRRTFRGILGNGPDPLQTGKDGTEAHFTGKYTEAIERDAEWAGALAGEGTGRDRLKKEREDATRDNLEGHAAVGAAGDIAGVDAVLNGQRGR